MTTAAVATPSVMKVLPREEALLMLHPSSLQHIMHDQLGLERSHCIPRAADWSSPREQGPWAHFLVMNKPFSSGNSQHKYVRLINFLAKTHL